MWERRSYDDGINCRCTVKYRGEIPQWPGIEALGVEWDDSSRGRNDGAINGIQYFTCDVPNAGSFIKASRPSESPRSFVQAVTAKYLTNPKFQEIELSRSKKVETYDVEDMFEKQSQLNQVESLSLGSCLINKMITEQVLSLPKLVRLDLSENLLEDPADLLSAISQFTSLRFLRLSGNRLNMKALPASKDGKMVNSHITELEMASTFAKKEDYSTFVSYFPSLETLSLANNRLESIPEDLPSGLVAIDLARNPIRSLESLPHSVSRAYLAGTKIVDFQDSDHIAPLLDLTDTGCFSWETISYLGERNVSDLQLHHVMVDDKLALERRPFVIARCSNLSKLDGTRVSKEERLDAELYTITAVKAKRHPPLPSSTWSALIAVHGEPPEAPRKSIRERLMTFYIDEDRTTYRVLRDAPISRLHWIVATLKGKDPLSLQIEGITDAESTRNDPTFELTQVSDIISEGQRLMTVCTD